MQGKRKLKLCRRKFKVHWKEFQPQTIYDVTSISEWDLDLKSFQKDIFKSNKSYNIISKIFLCL